jgi:hypothetical protein
MPVESSNKLRTELRKKVTNLDELKKYLNAHPDSEFPFVEIAWNDAVRKCKENEGKEPKITWKVVIDSDGIERKRKTSTTNYVTDPCRMYFKYMSIKKYSAMGRALRDKIQSDRLEEQEAFDELIGEPREKKQTDNEILDWIEMFGPDEREFLKKRYASYYDTYDINDGADRVTFKRLLSLEVEAFRIDIKRATHEAVDINEEKKITELIQSTLESMKWTKKQRSARDDMAKNRFTVWMDNLAKEGKFEVPNKEYEKDDIDFLIDTVLKSTSEMLS